MSLISGSKSLALATAGALDLRADIVEKALLHKVRECDPDCPSKYNDFLVEAFPRKQREKDACCCSCRVAVRLTVLSNEDMSSGLIAHKVETNVKEDCKTIGIDMRCTLHDASHLVECISLSCSSSLGRPNLGIRKRVGIGNYAKHSNRVSG